MNRKFNGNPNAVKQHRGYASKAAKQAFEDIRKDKDMRVHDDRLGIEIQINIILTENILEEDYYL